MLDADSLELTVLGAECTLGWTVLGEGGPTMREAAVSWLSADPEVATVSSRGVLEAIGYGTATVETRVSEPLLDDDRMPLYFHDVELEGFEKHGGGDLRRSVGGGHWKGAMYNSLLRFMAVGCPGEAPLGSVHTRCIPPH